jgi:alpha-glucosidase
VEGVQVAGVQAGGGATLSETPRLDRLPVFVRAGSILPRQSLVQTTAQTPDGPLSLDLYPGDDCQGVLYDDDGHSMAFTQGEFFRQEVRCTLTPQGLTIAFAPAEGRFQPWWRALSVTVHGWRGPSSVRTGGKALPGVLDPQAQTVSFSLAPMPQGGQTEVRRLAAS